MNPAAAFRIETERLVLREWTGADLPELPAIYGDPEVMRHIGDGRPLGPVEIERNLRATLRRYRRHGIGMWCVESREGGSILGHCGLQRWEGTTDVELGYLLRRQAWGRGLATEAARAVLDHAFEERGLHRVVAIIHPGNVRSIALAERLGMEYLKETAYKGREGLDLYGVCRD